MSNNIERNEDHDGEWKGLQNSVTSGIEDATEATAAEKIWDKRKKQWILYSIDQEIKEIMEEEKN
jgi:hypothetical protein